MKSIFATIAAALCTASAYASAKPRQNAPNFENVNAVVGKEFQKVSLSDYQDKYLVILFYPFDFTYVCPTELIAFSDEIAKFDAINAKVVGVSTDSHFTHLAWVNTPRNNGGLGEMNYPLLADISKDMSRNYGVLVEDSTDDMYGAALRGLFIIDGQGTIKTM